MDTINSLFGVEHVAIGDCRRMTETGMVRVDISTRAVLATAKG